MQYPKMKRGYFVLYFFIGFVVLSSCINEIELDEQDELVKETYIKLYSDTLVNGYYWGIRENEGQLRLFEFTTGLYHEVVLNDGLQLVSTASHNFKNNDLFWLERGGLSETNGLTFYHHPNDPWFLFFDSDVDKTIEIDYFGVGPDVLYNYSRVFADERKEMFVACFGNDFTLADNSNNRVFHFTNPDETPKVYFLRDELFDADIVKLEVYGRDKNDLLLFGEYYSTIEKVKADNRKIFAAKYSLERNEVEKTAKFQSANSAYEERCFLYQIVQNSSEVVFVKEFLARENFNMLGDSENDVSFFNLVKLNRELEEEWQITVDFGAVKVDPTALVSTKDHGFLVIGNINRGLKNDHKNFIVKLNSNGDVVLKKVFDNLELSWFIDACALEDGRIAILGSSHEFADGYEQFIIMLDENGELN